MVGSAGARSDGYSLIMAWGDVARSRLMVTIAPDCAPTGIGAGPWWHREPRTLPRTRTHLIVQNALHSRREAG